MGEQGVFGLAHAAGGEGQVSQLPLRMSSASMIR